MKFGVFTRQFLIIASILIAAVLIVSLISMKLMYTILSDETQQELEKYAILFEKTIPDSINYFQLDSIAKNYGTELDIRFTLIEKSGKVIADSHEDPEIMDNHADRPEIMEAWSNGSGSSTRYSNTLEIYMVYSAIKSRQEIFANPYLIRASKPLESLNTVNAFFSRRITFWSILLLVIAIFFSWLTRKYIISKIDRISDQAKRISSGEFSEKVKIEPFEEFSTLQKAINDMAKDLEKVFSNLRKQRENLDHILQSLKEGVIVINFSNMLVTMNKQAGEYTGLEIKSSINKDILGVIMIPELRELIENFSIDKVQYERSGKYFEADITTLHSLDQNIITIRDISDHKRLQQAKTDFVSNVSHELRTPLTIIKGYSETLEMEDDFSQNTHNYIQTIIRHTDRMIALVKDLLTLSQIEQSEDIQTVELNISDLIENLIPLFKEKSSEKDVKITHVNKDKEIIFKGDPSLLEIAISNLLENALKFSPSGKEIVISSHVGNSQIEIKVIDFGPGIPDNEKERIFERFYTLNKSRSSVVISDGSLVSSGTGLGLSITKNIVHIHAGSIRVEDNPTGGSVFIISLPK